MNDEEKYEESTKMEVSLAHMPKRGQTQYYDVTFMGVKRRVSQIKLQEFVLKARLALFEM